MQWRIPIMDRCVCEQTTASLMLRFHFRFPDGSSEQGKVCGNIDDCGLGAWRNENCVDEVNGYTCDCDEDYELMLLVNGSVCVAKECEIFSRTWFNGARVNANMKAVMTPWQL